MGKVIDSDRVPRVWHVRTHYNEPLRAATNISSIFAVGIILKIESGADIM